MNHADTLAEAIAEADGAATDLLRLYEAIGVSAVIITLTEKVILARCQVADDVVPLCKLVLEAHEALVDRVLN